MSLPRILSSLFLSLSLHLALFSNQSIDYRNRSEERVKSSMDSQLMLNNYYWHSFSRCWFETTPLRCWHYLPVLVCFHWLERPLDARVLRMLWQFSIDNKKMCLTVKSKQSNYVLRLIQRSSQDFVSVLLFHSIAIVFISQMIVLFSEFEKRSFILISDGNVDWQKQSKIIYLSELRLGRSVFVVQILETTMSQWRTVRIFTCKWSFFIFNSSWKAREISSSSRRLFSSDWLRACRRRAMSFS